MTATSTTTVGTHDHVHATLDQPSAPYISTDDMVARDLVEGHLRSVHHLDNAGVVHDEIHRLAKALAEAEQATTTARQAAWDNALAEGRAQALDAVRAWVLEHQSTYSLCDDGINDFFRAFDLEPKTHEYRVQISRTITQYAYITVEATDYDDAWEQAREGVRYGGAAPYAEWDNDTVSGTSVEDVTES